MSDVEDIAADVAAEQAPAAADPPAAYAELPDQKTVTAGSSRVVPSKAEAPAEAAVQTALGDQANAAEEVGAATAEEQEGKALAAEDRAAQSRVNQVDIEVEQRRREQALQAAQDQADAAEEKYRTYKIHDFFDDKSAGDRFVTKLFASIGAWGGGANPGLDELHRRMDMNFQRQRIGLMQTETFAKWKKEGVKDLQSRFEQENALLRLKQASATSAAADEAEAAQIRRGIPKAQAQANVTVTGLRTLAAKQKLEATQRLATTAHYASATTSGKVAPVKGGATKEKQDERTVFIGGKPLGLAPTSRTVKPIEDRAVQYNDALESLEALKRRIGESPIMGRAPRGDEYDRAVLAIAATTQANSSDSTTHHEALTLKNSVGALSPDAIDRAIEHLKQRQKQFLGNLQPIPGLPTPMSTQPGGKPTSNIKDLVQKYLKREPMKAAGTP